MKSTLVAVLISVTLSGCSSWKSYCARGGRAERLLTSKRQIAYGILLDARAVETSHTGAGGVPSCRVWSLQTLVADRKGPELLARLAREASVPGQLYALGGLRRVDPERYRELLPVYLANTTESVPVVWTCIVSTDPVRSVATAIEAGEWDATWFTSLE